ncbi:MAG TPA: 8-oxo-dGTP diphosphatase [Oscillospiraceae bacterium]|nr:8-oxo-dGTP diphosphatase [Oscillospiraceae bacterium]
MSRSEKIELAVLCMLRSEGKILLQKRVKEGDWHGLVTLPGGHVERNESVVDAVIREVREECGLTIVNPQLRGLKQFPLDEGRYLVFLFYADEFEGVLQDSAEGPVKWIPEVELTNYEMAPDYEALFKVFLDESLTEFLYVRDNDEWHFVLK